MKLVISGTLLLALVVSAPTKAQQLPPQTGLGDCVDFIIYASPTLTNQVNTAPYTFAYSSSSWIDKDNKVVYVMNYTCSSANLHGLYGAVGQVSHEMGHAFFDAPASLAGPKDAFVKRMCTDEGRAVLNNWKARSEILETSEGTAEIPLIASNASQLQAIILAGGEKLDERVGSSFCDNNTNSLTGENYRTFYGKWYDENVGVQSLYGTEV